MTQIRPDRFGRQLSARCPGLVGMGIHRRGFLVSSDLHTTTGGGQSLKRQLSAASFHSLLREVCLLLSQMTYNPPLSTRPPLSTLYEELLKAFSRPRLNYPPTSCMAMANYLLLRTPQFLVPMVLPRRRKVLVFPGSQKNRVIALSLRHNCLAMKIYCASKISWSGASQR